MMDASKTSRRPPRPADPVRSHPRFRRTLTAALEDLRGDDAEARARAAAAVAGVRAALPALFDDVCRRLLHDLERGGGEAQGRADAALGLLGPPAIGPVLVALMRSKHAPFRVRGLRLLDRLGPRMPHLPALLAVRALLRDPDAAVRAEAAKLEREMWPGRRHGRLLGGGAADELTARTLGLGRGPGPATPKPGATPDSTVLRGAR